MAKGPPLSLGLMLLYAGELDTLAGIGSVLTGNQVESFGNYADHYGLPHDTRGDRLRIK